MRVGVCIIDTTHKGIIPTSDWNTIQFTKVIDGVCGMAHQPSKFLIAVLLKYQHVAYLDKAMSKKAGWYEIHALPLTSLIASKFVQTSSIRDMLFGVWAFFSQGDHYTNYSSAKESLLQPMHTICVDEEFDSITMAKAFFVQRAIKSIYVKEDDQVLDIFSMGYGTTEALQQKRKVLSLACTNEQMTKLEALGHSIVDEDVELQRWVGLDVKDQVNTSSPHNDDGKTMEEEEFIEPLDETANALLSQLLGTG